MSGIEIKMHRGAAISGHVVIEGTTDRNLIARLTQQIVLYANTDAPGQVSAPNWTQSKVSPDGSFRVGGLRPGKARVHLGGWPPPKGLTQMRLERGGGEQKTRQVGRAIGVGRRLVRRLRTACSSVSSTSSTGRSRKCAH